MSLSDLEGHFSCLKPLSNSHISDNIACVNYELFVLKSESMVGP